MMTLGAGNNVGGTKVLASSRSDTGFFVASSAPLDGVDAVLAWPPAAGLAGEDVD